MQEEYTNVITLTDSDGSDVDFEVLDIIPYNDHEYAVLLPVDDESDSPEAVILELLEAEEDNEEDMLQGVEDEEILNAVFNLFIFNPVYLLIYDILSSAVSFMHYNAIYKPFPISIFIIQLCITVKFLKIRIRIYIRGYKGYIIFFYFNWNFCYCPTILNKNIAVFAYAPFF